MKNISFELYVDECETGVSVEIPWKVVTYMTSKGLEIFPELENLEIKIPKIEDGEVLHEMESIVLKEVKYEMSCEDVSGDRAIIISPKSISIDLEEKTAIVEFDLF